MRIDAKGKYYTKRVTTDELEVVIQTNNAFIYGTIHVRPDNRLSDEVEEEGKFIPVTDVTIRREDGTSYVTEFLVVNKRAMMWISPAETLQEDV